MGYILTFGVVFCLTWLCLLFNIPRYIMMGIVIVVGVTISYATQPRRTVYTQQPQRKPMYVPPPVPMQNIQTERITHNYDSYFNEAKPRTANIKENPMDKLF